MNVSSRHTRRRLNGIRFDSLVVIGSLVAAACAGGPAEREEGPEPAAFQPDFAEVLCPHSVTRGIENEVTCGYLTVPEDRSNPDGRTIQVFVTRIEPPAGDISPDPMFMPGLDLGWTPYYRGFAPMAERTHRQVIIMDPRGLGHSEPRLSCPETHHLASPSLGVRLGTPAMEALFLEAVQACRDRLDAQGVDVGAYNLAETAADAEDLRTALGIETWNLITTSTTSSVSFEIVRRYADHVRAVIYDSPDAPQVDLLTEAILGTRYSVEQVANACRADPPCGRAFPHIRAVWDRALGRLDERPSRLRVQGLRIVVDAATTVRVMRGTLTWEEMRMPKNVYGLRDHLFGEGPYPWRAEWSSDPILSTVGHGYVVPHAPTTRFAYGSFFSIVCHDELPFVDRVALGQAARGEPWYVEAYVHSLYFRVCDRWDAGSADADPHDPVVSDIPTLILHGRFDPYSTLPLIEQAATTLSNSWVVEFPNWGHNVLGSECGPEIRNVWIDDPTSPPDIGCVADMPEIDWRK